MYFTLTPCIVMMHVGNLLKQMIVFWYESMYNHKDLFNRGRVPDGVLAGHVKHLLYLTNTGIWAKCGNYILQKEIKYFHLSSIGTIIIINVNGD